MKLGSGRGVWIASAMGAAFFGVLAWRSITEIQPEEGAVPSPTLAQEAEAMLDSLNALIREGKEKQEGLSAKVKRIRIQIGHCLARGGSLDATAIAGMRAKEASAHRVSKRIRSNRELAHQPRMSV